MGAGDGLDRACGSPRCRGRRRSDFLSLPVAWQREYVPLLGAPLAEARGERIRELLAGGARG